MINAFLSQILKKHVLVRFLNAYQCYFISNIVNDQNAFETIFSTDNNVSEYSGLFL